MRCRWTVQQDKDPKHRAEDAVDRLQMQKLKEPAKQSADICGGIWRSRSTEWTSGFKALNYFQ